MRELEGNIEAARSRNGKLVLVDSSTRLEIAGLPLEHGLVLSDPQGGELNEAPYHGWYRRQVRIALADPNSVMAAKRDDELRLDGALPTRILTSIGHLKKFEGYPGHRRARTHDGVVLLALPRRRRDAGNAPCLRAARSTRHAILHLRHREQHGIFDSYLYHFDDVFEKAAVPIWPPLDPIWDDETRTWKTAPWWDPESRKWVDDG